MKRIFLALSVLLFICSIKIYAQDSLKQKIIAGVIQPGVSNFTISTYPPLWFQSLGVDPNVLLEYGGCLENDWAWSAGLIMATTIGPPRDTFFFAAGPFCGLRYFLHKGEKLTIYTLVSAFAVKTFTAENAKPGSSDYFTIVPSLGAGIYYFVDSKTALTASVEAAGIYETNNAVTLHEISATPPTPMYKIGVSFFYNKQH